MLSRSLLAATLLMVPYSVHAQEPATFKVGALEFKRPAGWEWVAVNSPMRKAQLRIPGAEAKDPGADVVFFHFGPGMGGGVEANAKRWLGQFESPAGVSKVEPQTLAGVKVTLVSTEGTFQSGMPGAGPGVPLSGYALLGAIIENPEGDVFVKMTGPAALVQARRQAFLDFLTSALTKP